VVVGLVGRAVPGLGDPAAVQVQPRDRQFGAVIADLCAAGGLAPAARARQPTGGGRGSLRLTWEHEDDFDPLLGEITSARNAMLAAEARMRLLIAHGREFTRPSRTGWLVRWPRTFTGSGDIPR
jgi:hypothetical protein